MFLEQQIRLERSERAVLDEALINIRVAYDPDDVPEVRALRHLASGQAANRDVVERAARGLRALELRCLAESHREFWLANVAVPVPAGARLEHGCVPLIADVGQFASIMAETRAHQARTARNARCVTGEALLVLPAN